MKWATLFHYTALQHLDSILAAGELRPTESHAKKPVVWLTMKDYAEGPPPHLIAPSRFLDGVEGPRVDKSAVRITVKVPQADAYRYDWWAKRRGVTAEWLRALEKAGGEPASTWWVVARPIPDDEWVTIEVRDQQGGWRPAAVRERGA